jgi:protein-disulfide isomerase/uncharacterized membrane protein
MDNLSKNAPFALAALLLVASFTVTTGDWLPYALLLQLAALLAACAGVVQRDALHGTIATAAACFGFNYYLFQRKIDAASGPSACNIDQVFNCDLINSSPYSTMSLAGVETPITLLGAAFYAGLAIAGWLTKRGTAQEGLFHQVNTLFAVFSLLYSVFLGWVSSQIGAVCVVCLSIYAGNVLLLWAGLKGMRASDRKLGEGLGAALTSNAFLVTSVVFVLGVVAGAEQYDARTALPSTSASSAGGAAAAPTAADYAALYKAPGGQVAFDGSEPIMGNPNGHYQIVEYADFGCPHCAHAKKEFNELVRMNPEVAVRFRYFPLSGACNAALPESPPDRCYAAFAAECAHKQGKFWEMATQLFDNMGAFDLPQLTAMAQNVGLDVPTWEACVASPDTEAAVRRNADAGASLGIQGTPAIYLRGVVPGQYVEVTRGPPAVLALIEAHRDGLTLPAPSN